MIKKNIDLSIYLVASKGENTVKGFCLKLKKAIQGGVSIIQLREKTLSDAEFIQLGLTVKASLAQYAQVPLIVNDRVHVAKAIKADGVHLGQSDKSVEEARTQLGSEALIGLSVESIPQAIAAEGLAVDYIAASPVFPTQTKKDLGTPFGLKNLKTLRELTHHRIVAIGGVNVTNAKALLTLGVDGLAVCSAIMDDPDPYLASLALRQVVSTFFGQKATQDKQDSSQEEQYGVKLPPL